MKYTPIVALSSSALLLTGCGGALWGNLLVLGVTVGIFVGTLALGRSSGTTHSAEASTSQSTLH